MVGNYSAAEQIMPVSLEDEPYGGCTLRVRRLRERALNTPTTICLEYARIMTDVFMKTGSEPDVIRKAKAFKEYCGRGKFVFIHDDELIVGHPGSTPRTANFCPIAQSHILSDELDTISTRPQVPLFISEEDKKLYKEFIEPYWRSNKGFNFVSTWAPEDLRVFNQLLIVHSIQKVQPGHAIVVLNNELILKIGINGIKKKIENKLTSLDLSVPGNLNKWLFLSSLVLVCEGVEAIGARYADLAAELAKKESNTERKAELEKIAKICKHVPANPARSFHEALQSLWFYYVATHIENPIFVKAFGRMDQYLYPYYRQDIENGSLTKEQAQELLECLWLKIESVIQLIDKDWARFAPGNPSFTQITIGGIRKNGQDAVNELSYTMLQATANLRVPQPNLSVRYNKVKNPDMFLRKAVDLASLGTGHPQFYNDEVGTKYVLDWGIPFEDAVNWCASGCKELNVNAGKIGQLRMPTAVNMGAGIELALLNGVSRLAGARLSVPETGDPRDFKTFEDFKGAVKIQLSQLIKKAAELALICEEMLNNNSEGLLISLALEDCIEKGKGVHAGGAKYYTGPEIIMGGLADVVNSLIVIRKLIYEEKKMTWDKLLDALNNNFEGHERIRNMCLSVPKYGNDEAEVDELATEIVHFVVTETRKYEGLYGGRRIAIGVAAGQHLYLGLVVGALPSGRKGNIPLSDGISPMQGTDLKGPTAVLKSVSKSSLLKSGLLNMKLDPSLFKDEKGIERFMGFMKAWYDLGIYHIQFNVISPEILKDAQKNPEKYRGLSVRVSGYSAYFVELDKDTQNDIIARATHATI